ncbi:tetratricopeptide repeat protein [[Clostridium] aminophilum]|uniref:Tetratricopeptide repeat-containing protein n=1 Tax=[Clostridium] aminophilum TaxID=1526 RepID=A0A1I6JM98_9FIRM|nr:tetratricopeptide repeat protein [[Clostridium] aminophilum]SFR79690.1 Tetratricopeptide repeat-containing protein [[Clostridium] aminophilum]
MIHSKQIRAAANSLYNEGLRRAKRRDLTGAAYCLKHCLNICKNHSDARDLLGLIYYEMGEISEALVQWVIAANLDAKDTRAAAYIETIQEHQRELEEAGEQIRAYNSALMQAQSGNVDLAILQLSGVVESYPRFVKAQLLLALLCIETGSYVKAGRPLLKVLKIDRENPKANRYMAIVKSKTGKTELEHKRFRSTLSHRRMTDDDVIIPTSYKENTGWQSILNIGAGLLLGAAAVFFLIMPARTRYLNSHHAQEIFGFNEQLNQKNEEIASLKTNLSEAETAKKSSDDQLNDLMNNSDSVLAQYSTMIQIENYLRQGNMSAAAALYPKFRPDAFTDETVKGIGMALKNEIETNGYQTLEDTAYSEWAAGRFASALDLYNTCLQIRPSNPKVILYMASISKAMNNREDAIKYYSQIIANFTDSEQAATARTQLAELSPEAAQAAANQADANRKAAAAAAATEAAQEGESPSQPAEVNEN